MTVEQMHQIAQGLIDALRKRTEATEHQIAGIALLYEAIVQAQEKADLPKEAPSE